MFDLDDPEPTALVTGASSGIGEEFARKLARRGYNVILVARRETRLRALADDLRRDREASVEVLPADLATDEGLERVLDRLSRGDVTMVVNNAGFGLSGEFAELPLDRQLEMLNVNVRAVTAIAHTAMRSMIGREHGTIINVAAQAAFQPGPFMAVYSASKAYVLSLSEALHEEARPHGVTVTCVCPGPVDTGFAEAAGLDTTDRPAFVVEPRERVVMEALSAARMRRALTVPGVAPKVTMVGNRLVPRFASRRIAARIIRHGTGT
jgi:short-subunit dehydrogenase